MEPLYKMKSNLTQILQEMAEIDKAEDAAGRDFTKNDRYVALQAQEAKLNDQIEAQKAIETERERRRLQSVGAPAEQRPAEDGLEDTPKDRGAAPKSFGPFKSFGEQLQAVIRSGTPGNQMDPRLLEVRAPTGQGEAVGEDGGLLVQTDFSTEIWKRAYTDGQILSRVTRRPLSTNANSIRIPRMKENSRADGSRWGGIRVYWRDEAGTVDASKTQFDELKMEVESLMGLVYLTDEIQQDASFLESYVRDLVSQEMTHTVEDAIISGNGVGKPLGILNAPALVTVAKESGQLGLTIVPENIVKMDARLWPGSSGKAVWLINQNTKPQLHLMVLTDGATYGIPVYMPANGLSVSPFGTLYGRPVIPVEHASTLGTVGDIMLVDLSQYLLIEKGGVDVASSIHVRFLYGEQVLRFTWRVNGQPFWPAALTPKKGTADTLSPFVALATRA